LVQGWMKGPAAKYNGRPLSPERVAQLTAGTFPWLRAMDIAEMYTADWSNDPFALVGFSFGRVGGLEAPAIWAAPLADTLFFAGEATCGVRHLGLVHGALESGARAAAHLIRTLA
jgi:monoamine oxidase